MHYHIHHKTIYNYNQPVFLQPHILRLLPHSNGWQKLLNFSLKINPEPTGVAQIADLDGNNFRQIWFTQPTETLTIEITSDVETYITNPFNYLLEPYAKKLPFDYPSSVLAQLKPYLKFSSLTPDPVIIELAQEILHEVEGNPLSFLAVLNQRIYDHCAYIIREDGAPWQPGITWKSQQGSCRDVAVLFMDVCRVIGLATRFVSGYQEGDPDQDQRDLHAWVEVYLPGGGWRGFDPTHGLAVSDRHITLAASALASQTAPVFGVVTPVKSSLETGIAIASQMEAHILMQWDKLEKEINPYTTQILKN